MSESPGALWGRWLRSREEEALASGIEVYRRPDHPFPRSRGRTGFDIAPDGSYTEYAIGPTDRSVSRRGRWEQTQRGLSISVEDQDVGLLEVLECDGTVLRVRRASG